MKSIDTLVTDIQGLFGKGFNLPDTSTTDFADRLSRRIQNKISEERGPPSLRMSNLGLPDRKLWYTINRPEKAEPLPPEAQMKYLFGDILEEMLLWLAREAGHTVEGEQDEFELFGVKGHRDAVIDGITCDVKSASSYSFSKFQGHLSAVDDSFGYLPQLGGYVRASRDDPKVQDKDRGAFLVVDKTLGKLCLDVHTFATYDWEKEIARKRAVLADSSPPPRCYAAEPKGKSGNLGLGVVCGYCQFKRHCWPGLRTFIYSTGPQYLVRVERLPEVPEV